MHAVHVYRNTNDHNIVIDVLHNNIWYVHVELEWDFVVFQPQNWPHAKLQLYTCIYNSGSFDCQAK